MIACTPHDWSSDDWQQYVNLLLHQHFCNMGLVYQRVADEVLGDGGLDGYSSDGQAYQAYADQGSNSKADRLAKQKQKIADDLPKLIKYQEQWLAQLGDLKLRTWSLVVPRYEDRAVLPFALKKAKEIRGAGLRFISNDFRAYVCDEQAFPLAFQQIGGTTGIKIKLSAPAVAPSEVAAFEKSKSKDVVIIDGKLSKVSTLKTKTKRLDCRRDYLKRYLYRENLLEALRKRHPPLRQAIDELLTAKGEDILTDSRLADAPPHQRLLEVKNELQQNLQEIAKGLSSRDNSAIAYGTIGHWLLNCNLQFSE